ncbi:MAG: phosphotransferase [Anaerolineae bacterium]|nr:phosphotransferase [Anaerolineae bacterium]
MSPYISFPGTLTPDWLTDVLHASSALPIGKVTHAQIQVTDAFNSHTSRLIVQYSPDAPTSLPTRLVLKRNTEADWAKDAGKEEVTFYRHVASLSRRPPIYIPCLAAEYDEASGNSYLLLQDVSDTHEPPMTYERHLSIVDGVPTPAHINCVVDVLAQHHALWWEHAHAGTNDLFTTGYWSRNAERLEMYLVRRKTSWANVLAQAGEWLPAEIHELYEDVLANLPRYWQRYLRPRFESGASLTLVHGDSYFSNFLCPKQIDDDGAHAYMLDWQSPVFDVGGHDLANMCATFWMPEQRHEDQREQSILRRYLAQLHAGGVANYAWDDLLLDYRHGLIYWLLVPVQDANDGSPKDYWWPKMQCLVHAFREWGCEGLLA